VRALALAVLSGAIGLLAFAVFLAPAAGAEAISAPSAATPPPSPARPTGANFAMAVQPDGKIVVVGGSGRLGSGGRGTEFGAIVRYDRDGSLDPSFGEGGVVISSELQPFTAVALQPNGRILVTSVPGELSRFLPNGKLDPSFGSGGIAPAGTFSASRPTSVAFEPGGAILVGGTTGYGNDPGEHWYGRLYRYSADGRSSEWVAAMSPSTGKTDPKSWLNGFLLEPNGTAIAAGSVSERSPSARAHMTLARLVQGIRDSPDPSFGAGAGLVTSDFLPSSVLPETANALAGDKGKVVAAGQAENAFLLARYGSDGVLDSRFGSGGATITDVHSPAADTANAVVVQHSGRIVVAGTSAYGCRSGGCSSLAVARYKPNGALDRSFGKKGIITRPVDTHAYGAPASEAAYAVASQPRGKILVGGLITGKVKKSFFLERLLPDGSLDPSFGHRGSVVDLPLTCLEAPSKCSELAAARR
jgi:uncharacterized delta-60 repeat protein